MNKSEIERINFFAKKAKSQGLSENEKKEQKELREKYLSEIRKNFKAQLDNIEIVD